MKLPHRYVVYDVAYRVTVTGIQLLSFAMALSIGRSLLFPMKEKKFDAATRKKYEERIEKEQKLREDEFLEKKGLN